MFPSFTSLNDREHKRQELQEPTQRRVRQANQKRMAYEATLWASDTGKITAGTSGNSEATQVSGADFVNVVNTPNAKILIAKKKRNEFGKYKFE